MADTSRTPVIVAATRTPIGRFLGGLSPLTAPELGAIAIREAVRRSGVNIDDIEEVIMGNVIQGGVGQAPARQAALKAGVPNTVSAVTINKVCGSGLKSVMLASQAIKAGDRRYMSMRQCVDEVSGYPSAEAGKEVASPWTIGVKPLGASCYESLGHDASVRVNKQHAYVVEYNRRMYEHNKAAARELMSAR